MQIKDYFEMSYWLVSIAILAATVYVIYFSPIAAVKVGRDLNDQQNKDNAKRQLFLTLFANRGSPISYPYVNGLNTIDVVFHDTPGVLLAWHKYYEALNMNNLINAEETHTLLRVDLLSEMAQSLGYGKLKQIDISKHYFPIGHVDQNRSEQELRQAAFEFFTNGTELYKRMINVADNPKVTTDPPENVKQDTSK